MFPDRGNDDKYVREEPKPGVVNAHPIMEKEEAEELNQHSLREMAEILDRYNFK